MTEETILRDADFDPKVKTYWLLSGTITLLLTIVGIPLLLLWWPLGLYITQRYLSRMACTLTTRTLKVKKGMWVRVEKTIPLDKITDMALVQGPIMRHFGLHRLAVETAGQSGSGSLVSLIGIENAPDFRQAVLDQRDQLTETNDTSKSGERSTDASGAGDALAELRDSALRIEALLQELIRRDQGSR